MVFGLDGLDPALLPTDRLAALLGAWPARGVHLLAWCLRPGRFAPLLGAVPPAAARGSGPVAVAGADAAGDTGPASAAPDTDPPVTALVSDLIVLDLPAAEAAGITGGRLVRPLRPGRAFWHDRLGDRSTVIVPFVRPDVAR